MIPPRRSPFNAPRPERIHDYWCACARCHPPVPSGRQAPNRAWASLAGMGVALILIALFSACTGQPGPQIIFGL